MPRVAFYAPMKAPDSPIPSGDREMARNLMAAIGADGTPVELVSRLRIYDKNGDAAVQDTLRHAAQVEATRLTADLPDDTDMWVTYHNYYKAPDLLGPVVSRARAIPYVQLESTRATSRLSGPWSGFAKSAHDACDSAQVIFYHTANDLITLNRERYGKQRLIELPPFLPSSDLPQMSSCDGPMLAVGMMRQGDKLDSYRILAETLALVRADWTLDIVGDGPAKPQVQAMMAQFGSRVRFLGQLERVDIQGMYANSSMLVWPGVNEAFGMVYLEAQAAGLPVVAQDRPGVRDVLAPGSYPPPDQGPQALAERIDLLLSDPDLRLAAGKKARAHIAGRHLMTSATQTFWSGVAPLLEGRP